MTGTKLEVDHDLLSTATGLSFDQVRGGDLIPETLGSDYVYAEPADEFYDHYVDYPGGLPEDTSLDTFSCLPAEDCVLPPASPACEVDEDEFIDSGLTELLIGIMPAGLYRAGISEADFLRASPYLADDGAVPTPTERKLLFAPAILLFEAGWQSKLARICGYSQGHLQQVYEGKVYEGKARAVTPALKKELLKAYREEIERCEERASRAMAGVIKILEAK